MNRQTPSDAGRKAHEGAFQRFKNWIRSSGFLCAILFAGTVLILYGIFFSICSPKKYDLTVGAISHVTINATKDVIDEVTTEERRNAAAAAVEPTYHFVEGVKESVLTSLDNIFRQLRTVQQYGLTLKDSEADEPRQSFTEEETDYAMGLVDALTLTRYQVLTLLRVDTAAFDEMVSTVTVAVENSLNTTIREGQVAQSIQTILQIVGYKVDVSLTQNILPAVLRTCIQPNMIIDQEATEQAREKAREAVEPVVLLQGQNIIREGDRITGSKLAVLRSLGLLSDNTYDYSIYGGALLLVSISMMTLLMLLRLLIPSILSDVRRMAVILLVLLICVLIADLCRMLPSIYILPVALASGLVTVLIHYRAGLCITIPMALIYAGFAFSDVQYTFYDVGLLLTMTITGGVTVVWFLKGHPQRVRVLVSGVIAAIVNLLTLISISLLVSTDAVDAYAISVWALAGCLISGILAFALQPLFETVFRLATPSKLMELTSPSQSLMRRMMIEAPGTYHHSIIVANLAESAAQRIGANPYLARAGAYYHDIGKLKRPGYFKENQMGENPHDKTDPYISAAILTSHTKDGLLMAQKEHLPQEVQDIILQHHGDTPVIYFYHKALQMSDGNPVDIREFRYEGPRPTTKEAAIVMLADTIEAAVRSMKDTTPKAIKQFIERLVRGKLEDGQLSESPLTLKDLDDIAESFTSILMGVFHERIEYPKVMHTIQKKPINDTGSKGEPPAAKIKNNEDTSSASSQQTERTGLNDSGMVG